MVIPCLYHLDKIPKLINIGWGLIFSEPNFTSDGIIAAFRHELPEVVGLCIFLFIKGLDTPKIVPLPSRAGGH